MSFAIKEAEKTFQLKEIPVGAIVVKEEKILSKAFNLRESKQNPLGHAELLAINKASKRLNSWRLETCKLYVSLEPCLMCIGAILQARLSHLIYACPDPKGGFSSFYHLDKNPQWKHKMKITSGILAQESSFLLKDFFKKLRN